jgi:hypothetical protein
VPRILVTDDEPEDDDDLAAWSAVGRPPRWRDQHSDWDEADFEDASVLTGDDAPLGALDTDRTEHSDLFSFDEPEPDPDAAPTRPTPRSARAGRSRPAAPVAVRTRR